VIRKTGISLNTPTILKNILPEQAETTYKITAKLFRRVADADLD
jgi:hypothetical protein